MKEIITEITIDAPATQVWKVLANFESYASWNPFIVSSEGKLEVGEKLVNTMLLDGKSRVFKPRILNVEENKSFDWLGSMPLGLFKGNHYFELLETDGKTHLIHGERFSGLLSSMIMKKIGAETEKKFQRMNEALKRRVEEMQLSQR